ncbi:MAG: NAD-dependent epimerase/dehydratase family protein [Candidatus Omnitrophota bacterium]
MASDRQCGEGALRLRLMKYLLAGGAGFIGNHLARHILKSSQSAQVTIYDNLCSGRSWHFEDLEQRYPKRFRFVKADIKDIEALAEAMRGARIVYHLAANADIAKAAQFPGVDFWDGTFLTHNILECVRSLKPDFFLYASGSGIYGDFHKKLLSEDHGPCLPISTYGASKLGCEAAISAYCHLFGLRAAAFRFANVIGPSQTHGVIYDFVRSLQKDGGVLKIQGDGKQDKSYLHVEDAIAAMRLLERKKPVGFSYFNVATRDSISVRQIADTVVRVMGLKNVAYQFTGGRGGWKGDVPVVRLDSKKIRSHGWSHRFSSVEAVERAAREILAQASQGRFV